MNKQELDNVKDKLIAEISQNGKINLSTNPRKKERIEGVKAAVSEIETLLKEEAQEAQRPKTNEKILARNKKAAKAATIKRQEDFKNHYAKMAAKAEYLAKEGKTQSEIAKILNDKGFRTQKGMKLTPTHINRMKPLIQEIENLKGELL